MADRPIEAVIVLTHTRPALGRSGTSAHVAMHATESWLQDLAERGGSFVCNTCYQTVTLADVVGDEKYVPTYRPPRGGAS